MTFRAGLQPPLAKRSAQHCSVYMSVYFDTETTTHWHGHGAATFRSGGERVSQTGLGPGAGGSEIRAGGATGATRMRVLADTYPELRTFTPDATLSEIKTRYGLNTFEDVREFGKRRQHSRLAAGRPLNRSGRAP